MASTFSTNLNLELQGTGEDSGVWGQNLNNNVFSIIDAVMGNTLQLPLTNIDVTLTTNQSQNNFISLTGILTGNVNIIFPAIGRTYFVSNKTTGAFTVLLKTSDVASNSILIGQGKSGFYILHGDGISTPTYASTLPNLVKATSTGAFAFTVPPGVTTVLIKAWGAGGGGGLANAPSGAGGGGGGAYFETWTAVTPGAVLTGSVGAGGTAGSPGVNGGNGGDTSIVINGNTYTAGGGLGGRNSNASTSQGGSVGGSVTGPVVIGRSGFPSVGAIQGYSGTAILYYGGEGGGSPLGAAGGTTGPGSAGNAGSIPGGGGGGSAAISTAVGGSVGGRGELWIIYS